MVTAAARTKRDSQAARRTLGARAQLERSALETTLDQPVHGQSDQQPERDAGGQGDEQFQIEAGPLGPSRTVRPTWADPTVKAASSSRSSCASPEVSPNSLHDDDTAAQRPGRDQIGSNPSGASSSARIIVSRSMSVVVGRRTRSPHERDVVPPPRVRRVGGTRRLYTRPRLTPTPVRGRRARRAVRRGAPPTPVEGRRAHGGSSRAPAPARLAQRTPASPTPDRGRYQVGSWRWRRVSRVPRPRARP